ncbi:DUF3055 domain-containing protein [Effusibacillus pohliae]|uniref:DUF3055 domain-containing protein n=1 Tax=Effusibacillus pohliae TaxID=232270 RepID=UPI0003646B6C|nr:DUF3055 domain-containing protein [Effusibacillus pohliae]
MEQILFDHQETTHTRHVGFVAGGTRFDFVLIHSQHFFGKTIVTCLQSNRSALLDTHDVNIVDELAGLFNLQREDALHLADFLKVPLSDRLLRSEY